MEVKVTVDNESPYMGLDAFEEQYKDFFFGRDKEVNELLSLVDRNVTTVLFGKSGLGKTSLLKAGLIPKLRKKYFLPIFLRVNFNDADYPPLDQVRDALEEHIQRVDPEVKPYLPDTTLWEYLHASKILGGFVRPILIFDQFEEIFTIGRNNPKRVNELVSALTNLIENQIPISVQEKYADLEIPFDFDVQNFRIVFSLREDYLPQLENLQAFIPSLRKSRLRLLQMNRANAIDAVYKPGRHIIDRDVAEKLVDKILSKTYVNFFVDETGGDIWENHKVEPFLLSLICFQVNETRVKQYQSKINIDLVNKVDIQQIIKNFYHRSTHDIGPESKKILENSLLTQDGYRKLQSKSDLLLRSGIGEDDINKLINRRIVRNEIWNGREHLELIHDVLVPVVKDSRDKRIEEERERAEQEKILAVQRKAEQERDEQERRFEQERREQKAASAKRKKTFSIAMAFALMVAGALAFGYLNANQQRKLADLNLVKANANQLAAMAVITIERDPTQAFRQAERAFRMDSSSQVARWAVVKSFYQRAFYNVIARTNAQDIAAIDVSQKQKLVAFAVGNRLVLADFDGREVHSENASHLGAITAVAFSPSGDFYATAGSSGEIKVWQTRDHMNASVMNAHNEGALGLVFNAAGDRILSFARDNKVVVSSIDGNMLLVLSEHTNNPVAAVFTPQGYASAGLDRKLIFYDPQGKPLKSIFLAYQPTDMVADSAGNLWVADKGGALTLYDPSGEIRGATQFDLRFNDLAMLADGSLLAACSDNSVLLFDSLLQVRQEFKGHDGEASLVVATPDARHIFSTGRDRALRHRMSGQEKVILRTGQKLLYAISDHSHDNILVGVENTLTLWDVSGQSPTKGTTFEGHSLDIVYVDYCPATNRFASASVDNSAIVWDSLGKPARVFEHPGIVYSALFNREGTRLLTSCQDHSAKVWDIQTGELLQTYPHGAPLFKATYSPDSRMVLTACMDDVVRLWNENGDTLATLPSIHSSLVTDLVFAPDGKHFASASWDMSAKVWSIDTVDNRLSVRQVAYLSGHSGRLTGVFFSPDGKWLLTSSEDGAVKLWDINGNELVSFDFHSSMPVHSANFTEDGHYILSVGRDETIRKWPVSPQEIIRQVDAQGLLGPNWRLEDDATLGGSR